MQAVILAAGLGKRLGRLTRDSTKCMVEMNGRRLIEYALDGLVEAGVRRVVLVVGHGADEVRQFVGNRWRGVPIEYVANPLYAETNNIYSLYLARDLLAQDDTLLLESDVVFEPAILADCLGEAAPNVVVVAPYEPWMEGSVVTLGAGRQVLRFFSSGDLGPDGAQAFKTVNVYKLSAEFSRERFLPALEAYVGLQGRDHYYEDVLKVLVFMGGDNLVGLSVGDRRWYEIDDVEDLDIAGTLFAEEEERPARFHGRYGGYWRFGRLKDFCYLANPYFPPPRLLEAMAAALPDLVGRYPSGLRVQRGLAAKVFGCDASSIVVGNGAAELIRALLASVGGRIGVPVPTFEEYPQCIPADRLRTFVPPGPDFRYDAHDLLCFCRDEDLSVLVLVNPDNPSGQFLPREAVIDLLGALHEEGVRLVLDESFVDFVDGSGDHGLLSQTVLERFPDLVVIKSISKSYGVPGLRLGVLASGDTALVERVGRALPIWNVNAIAEWFLQNVSRWEADYRHACRQVALERARLFEALSGSDVLRPVESLANYLLCEVRPGHTSAELSRRLLNEHWILARDCAGKRGFGGAQYVRLAVRNAADNDLLVDALRALEGAPASAAIA